MEAEEKNRLAILDIKPGPGVSNATAKAVTDLLISHVVNAKAFVVIERADLAKVMEEQALQNSGCTETDCAVKIGQLLAANKILTGSVSLLGTKYILNIRVIDVEKGRVENAAPATSATLEGLENGVISVVQMITGKSAPVEKPVVTRRIPVEEPSPGRGVRMIGIIPGAGRFSEGEILPGSFFLGGFLGGLAVMANEQAAYRKAVSRNDDMITPYLMVTRLGTTGTLATYVYFSGTRSDIRAHANKANQAAGIAAAIWIWGLFDNFLLDRSTAVVSPRFRPALAVVPGGWSGRGKGNDFYFGFQGKF